MVELYQVYPNLYGSSYPSIEELKMLAKVKKIRTVISLEFRGDEEEVERLGLKHYQILIPDFEAPTQEQIREFVEIVDREIERGAVLVHCLAGRGRTGTMLACYLVWKGWKPEEAIREVRKARPGAIETIEQEEAIMKFYKELRRNEFGEGES